VEPPLTPARRSHTNLPYRNVQAVVEVNERVVRPELAAQLSTRDQLAATRDQDLENLVWLVLQLDPPSSLPEIAGRRIELEHTKAQEALLWPQEHAVPR
jgi:hypothetical protein